MEEAKDGAKHSRALTLRPAKPPEAELLSALALASKAYWGYSAEFIEACRQPLRVTPQNIRSGHYTAAQEDQTLVGFYSLTFHAKQATLDHLFVAPTAIGRGVGKALWLRMLAEVKARGLQAVTWEADPHAEAFYQAMGAQTVGAVPSQVDPERHLPLMRFELA